MEKTKLEIPKEIQKLINSGVWPKDDKESMRQNVHMLISKENLKKIAPDEEDIYFYPPPFQTVKSAIEANKEFWIEYGAIDQLQIDKCLIIGDFGLGSDAAIILDYSEAISKPVVKRQVWKKDGNTWEKVASNFKEFINKIELTEK